MKTRKVISAILAGAFAISALSISASAADKTVKAVGGTTLTIKAGIASPEIEVSLPSAVSTVINPYGVGVTVKGEVYGDTGVASPLYTVRNFTTSSKIMVSAKATVKSKTAGITVVSDPTVIKVAEATNTVVNSKEKQVAAWVVAKAGTAVDLYKGDVSNATAAEKKAAMYANEEKVLEDAKYVETTNAGTAHLVIFNEPAAAHDDVAEVKANKGNLMILPKATKAEGAKEVSTYGYGQLQIGGLAAKGADWDTAKDNVQFELVLNVTPCADDATVDEA